MLKAKIVLGVIGLILFFLIAKLNINYKDKFIKSQILGVQQELQINYEVVLHNYQQHAKTIFQKVITNETILELLRKNLNATNGEKKEIREKLYKIIKDEYSINKILGMNLLLFCEPNNRVLLRVHQPKKFGDDVTKERFAIKKVNSTHKELRGFESGKFNHGFRNVFPIIDKDNKVLGCIDVGYSSEYLQNTLEEVHKIHTHFLVSKKISKERSWGEKYFNSHYSSSMEDDHYMVSIRKNIEHNFKALSKQTLKNNQNLIHEKMDKGKTFSIYGINSDMALIVSFKPIFSLKNEGRPAGYIVSYRPNKEIRRITNNYYYINIIVAIILFLILYQIHNMIQQKKILEGEVAKKTKELKTLNMDLENKVQTEVEKNIKHEIKIYEQSKLAAMGDMIGNIVHQWRQPLSSISTIVSTSLFHSELGTFEKKDFESSMNKVLLKVQYLSETIETFRNFLKEKKEKQNVILEDRVKLAISISDNVLHDNHIEFRNNIDYTKKTQIDLVLGELVQVIINIINNAKDILLEKKIDDPWVDMQLKYEEAEAIISIEDNGGGIPHDVLPRIFEQYFTTKDEDTGTGLGLYMSHKIVTESLDGDLSVHNTDNGAKFVIRLPL